MEENAQSEFMTFDLLDGFKDEKGVRHKRVTMRQSSMEDQIKLKSDQRIQELMSSSYSLDAKSQAERRIALCEYNEYYCILFKQTVLSIGDLQQDYLRNNNVFLKLSERDINKMVTFQTGGGGSFVKVDRIVAIVRSLKITDDARKVFFDKLRKELGEDSQVETES